ncbi:MAG: 4-(cytidine 5'-diphospho)-2-C-methyl-D-erythritol kinase [Desulfobacterales bacterium]
MSESCIRDGGDGCLKVFSPAKVNLFLQVRGKRPDGYHELLSLMCPVSLHDVLTLHFDRPEISIFCSHPGVPPDGRNLAWRAAELFFDRAGISGGVHISIEKHIPVAGGLGGGSSNAASVLMALNRHYGFPFDKESLSRMGLSLGADVPFFLFGGPAIATGVGENLSEYRNIPSLRILFIAFDFSVSTAMVYKNLNLGLTKCKKIIKDAPFEKYRFDPARHLCNDLETVTEAIYPAISEAKKVLMDCGAAGSLMSGSGPTVFGIFSDAKKAEEAYLSVSAENHEGWRLYPAELRI